MLTQTHRVSHVAIWLKISFSLFFFVALTCSTGFINFSFAQDTSRINLMFEMPLPSAGGWHHKANNMTMQGNTLIVPHNNGYNIDIGDIHNPVLTPFDDFAGAIRLDYRTPSTVYCFTNSLASTLHWDSTNERWNQFNSYGCDIMYADATYFSYTPYWVVQNGRQSLLEINCGNSTSPESIYELDTTRQTTLGTFRNFHQLYYSLLVPSTAGLEIYNIFAGALYRYSNCILPNPPTNCDASYTPYWADESDYAFVTDEEIGITVVNIENKSSPYIVSQLEIPNGATDIEVTRYGYAYVSSLAKELHVVDIRDVNALRIIASTTRHLGNSVLKQSGCFVFAYDSTTSALRAYHFERMPVPDTVFTFSGSGSAPRSAALAPSSTLHGESPFQVSFGENNDGANPTSLSLWSDTRTNALHEWFLNQDDVDMILNAGKSVRMLWSVSQTGGENFYATLTFRFTRSQVPTSIANPVTEITRAVRLVDNTYTDYPCTVAGPDENGVYTATVNNVTSFSEWGLGTADSYLSVEMTSFLATAGDNSVTIQWVTETEINNSHFNLYRAVGASGEFEQIARIAGNGTVAGAHNYTYTDTRVTNGVTYRYRISDVDIQGVENFYPEIVTASPHPNANLTTPGRYALIQNYPNPFNASTVIEYSIREPGEVDLTVFDALGRQVSRLVHENLKPGEYRVTFSAEGVPSGMYYYRLQTQRFTSMRSMVVVK